MHCASCSLTIERALKKMEGVESAEVSYGTEKAKIIFDESKVDVAKMSKVIDPLGYTLVEEQPAASSMNMTAESMGMSESEHAVHLGLNQTKKEKLAELQQMKIMVASVIPLAIVSLVLMGWDLFAQLRLVAEMSYETKEFFHHLMPLFATYTLFVVGKPYLLGLYRFMRYGKANMDTLIGMGTLAAFVYSFVVTAFEEQLRPFLNVDVTYYDVTIVVIAFIALGKFLEVRSKLKTGDAIEALLTLQAKTALVVRDGIEIELPLDQVVHGDVLIVKPAGKIPVDGIVLEGASYVDEAMITGEPIPVSKSMNDRVIAGTINTTGSFTMRATKIGTETMLARIIQMVEDAQGSKAPIQALADRISGVFVPIVLVIAFVSLGLWLILGTRTIGFSQALSFGLTCFVGVLVIACPCALGLATPTAIIVGVGKGAREGILIKDAATLEKLHQVNVVVVDKTGTITKGKPEIVGSMSSHDHFSILASLESKSEHPIATAIIAHAKANNIGIQAVMDFEVVKGKGLHGKIDGTEYFAGNTKLMEDLKLPFEKQSIEQATLEGKTPVILATRSEVLGIVYVADAIKPEAIEAVRALHKRGIKVVMLTGDHHNTAQFIATQAGIDDVVSEVMPADKLVKIKELQSQGKVVAMAGDGINDAPALAQADVGIAMGTGTDVAIESSGITLLGGDLSKLVKAIRLSEITMRGIKQNLFWAFFYNIVGIPLAAGLFYPFFGLLLNPIFAGAAMAFSSVSVVGNSLRLKTKKL